jgi:hypothetical protein
MIQQDQVQNKALQHDVRNLTVDLSELDEQARQAVLDQIERHNAEERAVRVKFPRRQRVPITPSEAQIKAGAMTRGTEVPMRADGHGSEVSDGVRAKEPMHFSGPDVEIVLAQGNPEPLADGKLSPPRPQLVPADD